MGDAVIKVGYLVSYDWHLLKNSLPLVYADADTIVLAIDVNRRSWAGRPYKFDESSFREFVRTIDTQHKISLYEADFYQSSLTTMENEVRERNMLAEKMGRGGWHIQLDCDEYPVNFHAFVVMLKRIDPFPNPSAVRKPVNVSGNWISIIKEVTGGYIIVKPQVKNPELCFLATQVPDYRNGRRNGYFNLRSPLMIVHETRSRTDEEFYFKLKNWGHNEDFDTDSYFAMWKAIDGYNYKFIKNFNPIGNGTWPELSFVKANNINDLIEYFRSDTSIQPSKWSLLLANSRNLARLKGMLHKVMRNPFYFIS